MLFPVVWWEAGSGGWGEGSGVRRGGGRVTSPDL